MTQRKERVRLLSASGCLGYGFAEDSLNRAVAAGLDLIACDGGSSDPGAYYLGAGKAFVSEQSLKRDTRLMLHAAVKNGIPMIVSSSGGGGGAPHVDILARIVRDIAREDGLHFKLALIGAEQSKAAIAGRVREGRVRPLGAHPPLDVATVERAERIVGVMGPEPFSEALDGGAQVILAGRSSDPAPFAALAIRHGKPPAQSWYAGKMLECGATSAIPKGHDCLVGTVDDDSVVCEPPNPARKCVPYSVVNHSLHENASPIRYVEPGGILTTEKCTFDAISDRAVRISGMEWTPMEYTVKLEAAELAGYRTIAICGTRDPMFIAQLDEFMERVREIVAGHARGFGIDPGTYSLTFHVYGRDGVMGSREPIAGFSGHELGFVIDVVGQDAEQSAAVLAAARTTTLHSDFPGRLCGGGNIAFPFSPSDVAMGPVYRFSMSHVVVPDSPCEMFPISYEAV